MGALLRALAFVYDGPRAGGAFIDVGAHVGRWAAEVLTHFGHLENKKYAKEFGTEGDACPLPAGPAVTIYCLEPVAANFDRLKDRAKRSAWQLEGVQLMRAGAANVTGKAEVWAASAAVDPEASLTPRAGLSPVLERMVTVDILLKKSVAEGRAFLLRLAANGHEGGALLGARKSLKRGLVRFVVFEVSPRWGAAGHAVADAVKLLWRAGLACFALLPQPVPVSGPFWQEAAGGAGPSWYSVFCGSLRDAGLRRVLRILDPDAPDYARPSS